jgi:ABC-2 type transport system permease protein
MKKIIATIIKEWVVMKRDIAGMALILFMPAVLMVVMALVEDAPFRNMQEVGVYMLAVDNDHSSVSREIIAGLEQTHNFNIIDSIDGHELTEQQLKNVLYKGKYKIGIVIPKGTAAEITNSTNKLANTIAVEFGNPGALPTREARDSIYVSIYFSPDAKPIFRSAIKISLDKYFIYAGSNILMKKLASLSGNADTNKTDLKKMFNSVQVKEAALSDKQAVFVSSVEQNVPGWTIFGMFLIAVPMANHLVREREEGSFIRILLIPNSQFAVALGKILFYTLICFVQFFLMMSIGIWLLPSLGLSALDLGAHPYSLIPVALCISFASTCYGYFVSSLFTTANQAMPFGSISVVILSALGGIWMPIELLSPFMQHLSIISPLRWSHAAVNGIILMNNGVENVWQYLSALILFGISFYSTSIYLNNRRHQTFK